MKRRKLTTREHIEDLKELVEYQGALISSYEKGISHEDLCKCFTCDLSINAGTIDEFESTDYVCGECGPYPWCGRTACAPIALNTYEIQPDDKRLLCDECAKALGVYEND